MTDLLEISGYLLGLYVTGYCTGLFVSAFRRFMEQI